MKFPFPVLVGDIGGTNARFAIVGEPGAAPSKAEHKPTHAFPTLEAAIEDAVPHLPARPKSVIACAAGPVRGRAVTLTNAHWEIDGPAAAKTLGLAQGLLLNDFEAQALTVPIVEDDWVRKIGDAPASPGGTQLVVGPGTGLGASALLEIEDKYLALPSEAGHVDFGPVGSEEGAIWPHIPMTQHGRISAETVLSGPGLLRLHKARHSSRGMIVPALDDAGIVERAKANHYSEEAETVRLFWRLAARFAGDMTMAFMATGGVTFSGGMLPRLIDLLDPAAFRARYEDKAPFGELLRRTPTRIIVVDDAVLSGLGAVAAAPGKYAIDYGKRAWC